MTTTPYSLSDAEKICKEFQHLTGQYFDNSRQSTIDCIAVAPFDQSNKNRFIIYYLLFDDAHIALRQDYQGLLFDVIVIAGAKDGSEMLHESIDVWLAKNKKLHCQVMEVTSLAPTSIPAYY
ncbi:MAG: hypothetical protein JWQ38_1997 [Flavipsychrobacter sp.]|nr:hypothetical protein [Flavipsychrobacter sp.]